MPFDGLRQFQATLLPHFENCSAVQGCFLLAQDVTQQIKDRQEVVNAKEEWERTFDSILDEIITVQDKDFHIVKANSAAERFFGLPREEIIGRLCYELFREDNLPCSACPAHGDLLDGKTHCAEILHNRLQKTFLVAISPMLDAKGEFIGLVHSAKDITGFKLANPLPSSKSSKQRGSGYVQTVCTHR